MDEGRQKEERTEESQFVKRGESVFFLLLILGDETRIKEVRLCLRHST